jgi:hypothetical protein
MHILTINTPWQKAPEITVILEALVEAVNVEVAFAATTEKTKFTTLS